MTISDLKSESQASWATGVTKDSTASGRGEYSRQQVRSTSSFFDTDPSHFRTSSWTCDLCALRKMGKGGAVRVADRIEKMRAFVLCSNSTASELPGGLAGPWSPGVA
jgi:hypothetical protein